MNCKSKQFDKAEREKLKVRERTKANGLSEELSDLNRFDRIDLFADPPHCYSLNLQGIRSEMQKHRVFFSSRLGFKTDTGMSSLLAFYF